MITLESGGMSHSTKIAYSISKIPIPQNERKQTGPYGNSALQVIIHLVLLIMLSSLVHFSSNQQSGCGNLGLLGSASSLYGLWNIIGAGLLTGS
jgi:hypothetical protein